MNFFPGGVDFLEGWKGVNFLNRRYFDNKYYFRCDVNASVNISQKQNVLSEDCMISECILGKK